jgi:hypothetical protein
LPTTALIGWQQIAAFPSQMFSIGPNKTKIAENTKKYLFLEGINLKGKIYSTKSEMPPKHDQKSHSFERELSKRIEEVDEPGRFVLVSKQG